MSENNYKKADEKDPKSLDENDVETSTNDQQKVKEKTV